MTIQNVNRLYLKKQLGASLVEFMIAALIGAIALTVIGGVFLNNQKSSIKRAKEIMLQQQVSGVLHQLKTDLSRAGFNGDNEASFTLSGATAIVDNEPESIGYTYRVAVDGTQYNSVLYKKEGNELKYCYKQNEIDIKSKADLTSCYKLFDPDQIKVTVFDVQRENISSDRAKSAWIHIKLSAELKEDSNINRTMEIQLQQRNWQ